MQKESLFKVYLEFYVVAKDCDEAADSVALSPEDTISYDTQAVLSEEATEEAMSFLEQLQDNFLEQDRVDETMIFYLKSKGIKDKLFITYKEIIDALARGLKERKGVAEDLEED